MPLKLTAREREPQPSEEQEEIEQRANQPKLEPAEAKAMEPGRPYQAFVESKLRQYLRDNNIRSLVKPTQDEIHAAAMPILCQALRNRPGHKRHHAVVGIVQHALETGWIKPPFSKACESPNYVEALIQLAHEAGWLAREIILPDYPGPEHPPLYYRMDLNSHLPVPTEDSLIRGNYVYTLCGHRVTRAGFIHPWLDPDKFPTKNDFVVRGWDVCYRLGLTRTGVEIFIHGISTISSYPVPWITPLNLLNFTPNPYTSRWSPGLRR